MTRLKKILKQKQRLLDDYGVTITYDNSRLPSSYSANLDSVGYVGTITYWPDLRFEFQFNDAKSGDVVLLEERDFAADAELGVYLEEIFRTRLK